VALSQNISTQHIWKAQEKRSRTGKESFDYVRFMLWEVPETNSEVMCLYF